MICADTSSLIALLEGEKGTDVQQVQFALQDGTLYIAPVTVTEMLSAPDLSPSLRELVCSIPQLEIRPGYWERAGNLRAELRRHHFKAKVADSLIAQSCLDHDLLLVTRDRDFLAFEKLSKLKVTASGHPLQ